MNNNRIEIKGTLSPGLLFGGFFITGMGVLLYWVYFTYRANPPTLVASLFLILFGLFFLYLAASAYTSCFILDETGIIKTSLLRGFAKLKWDRIESVVEKPGIEHGIVKMEIVSDKKVRIDIYSNWVKDYDFLFQLVDLMIGVDTQASRVANTDSAAENTIVKRSSKDKPVSASSKQSSYTGLRLRVTGVQILYFLGVLLMSFFMILKVFR